jgi:glycogen debranching enzyme
MHSKKVVSLDGSSFLIANAAGDLVPDEDSAGGLFYKDMRHLSVWRLKVNSSLPQVLACDDLEYYFTQHFLAPRTGTIYQNPYLSVARRRSLGSGFVEYLEVSNHSSRETLVELEYEFDCDFADLFEVKDALHKKKGERSQGSQGKDWVLVYRREGFVRKTILRSPTDCQFSEGLGRFRLALAPKEQRTIEIRVIPVEGENEVSLQATRERVQSSPRSRFEDWVLSVPRLECDIDIVRRVYRRSLIDLSALRFYPDPGHFPDASVPSAGLPWFMALFGRDSLLTSYQTLPFVPKLAESTLKILARLQGTKVDPFRDEEPGKILHELRFGELTVFDERPQSPYYGAADSTPLFLILLDEYERWTGDRELVRALEPNARRALEWIDRHGDRDGDSFVEYQRAQETGLENQCWKDSPNSILFSNGEIAKAPRATCEIQGYVYDAKVRSARLAREIWNDPKLSSELLEQAAHLRARFNETFWLEDKGYYALALDRDKRCVDSLTSNIGHLLWSGIVPGDRAARVRDLLMSPELFSGWGIRTMGTREVGYNPIEYHNGTVWPHDCSIIAKGLARYGYRQEASRLCEALIGAAFFFDYRLPEVFAGYPREETEFPVEYPTASSPQAWSTAAPLLALRVILGLEAEGGKLLSHPFLPDIIGRLSMTGFRGPWGSEDVHAGQERQGASEDFAKRWFERRTRPIRRIAG